MCDQNDVQNLQPELGNEENDPEEKDAEQFPQGENAVDQKDAESSAPDENSVDEQDFERLNAEVEKWKAMAQRASADFVNYQERMKREREQLSEFALRSFVESLLPTLDNFHLSLKAAAEQRAGESGPNPHFDTLMEAVQMIYQTLLSNLQNRGLETIDEGGVLFNPEIHEAVARVPMPNMHHNHIIEIVRTGYRWHGKTLRPAQVVVCDNPDSPSPENAKASSSSESETEAQEG